MLKEAGIGKCGNSFCLRAYGRGNCALFFTGPISLDQARDNPEKIDKMLDECALLKTTEEILSEGGDIINQSEGKKEKMTYSKPKNVLKKIRP